MYNQAIGDRQTVIVPIDYQYIPITRLSERDNESVLRVYKPDDNEFLELVHTALKLRSDILTQPGHKGLDISEDAVMSCIPDRFVHFTCDNIDINDSSLDGKNSFHATQVAAWQRGPALDLGCKMYNH